MEELIKLATNQIGAVVVVIIFVWFLAKVFIPFLAQKDTKHDETLARKDKDLQIVIDKFNCTIENQLNQANQVIKENTAAQVKTNDAIQKLSECINRINRKTGVK